jgi:putative heme-binding domain-containing protein
LHTIRSGVIADANRTPMRFAPTPPRFLPQPHLALQRGRPFPITWLALPAEDARLDAVIAQRLQTASTLRPDAARGAPLFTLHCAVCHRFRDQGGAIGPGLDGVASRHLTRLVEDVLDPSRNVDPAFRVTTLTFKNGGTTSGLNHRVEGERMHLTDPASGLAIVVDQREVSEVTRSPLSAMPSFETILSEGELFDLLEFLRTPPPAK